MLEHIAIIMDGNGRWANARKLPRTAGHEKGSRTVQKITEAANEKGVKFLTLYAFSAENWQRPPAEVKELMNLLRRYLKENIRKLEQKNIRISIIGDRAQLEQDLQDQIDVVEKRSAENTGLHLNIALSYGGRQEVLHAATRLAEDIKNGTVSPETLTQKDFAGYLYTGHTPDPDLLIRTGGEQRLSNFLLWQSAYTELYFTDILWPDFGVSDLDEAIKTFYSRERRFGNAEDTQPKSAAQ
jgi:undecaprenyl diphosphate synthase